MPMARVGIIVAMDPKRVIGIDGKLPWRYPADLNRFQELTMGGTLIMGHTTWESIPKPLAGRRVLVLSRKQNPHSRHPLGSFKFSSDLGQALLTARLEQTSPGDIWICGGAQVYEDMLTNYRHELEFLDITQVPQVEVPPGASVTTFPDRLNAPLHFPRVQECRNRSDSRLRHVRYDRF